MKTSAYFAALCVACVAALALGRAQAGIVTFSFEHTAHAEYLGTPFDDSHSGSNLGPPLDNSAYAGDPGELGIASNSTLLVQPDLVEHEFLFQRPGLAPTLSGAMARVSAFSVDQPLTYELSGSVALEQGGAGSLTVWLLGTDPGNGVHTLFEQVLNSEGGSTELLLSGALTGTVLPGWTYELYSASEIRNLSDDEDNGDSAGGIVRLTLVPEPATLLGLAALGLLAARRAR